MKKFILSAALSITCFISKAQISPNDSVSTSAATVPSGQVLYLNFNNNFNDQSGFNNAVSNYNVTFTTDQNNTTNAAASFDGCAGNRAYLKVGNSANLQVSNAMTISFWAKVDLSMGMNPHDGACSSVGHHILFAKGGDGYGTSPNGFYSKLEPNGSTATNLFGSSPNSGNLAYTTTINSPNSWKFYTYVITSTQYELYINGTLQNSGSHNINFNEINNEDLYIGVLGPKSTPALGIANWYPMRGQIDDFRVFNRALNNTEINGLYAPEETGGDAPAITQIIYLGDSRYVSPSREFRLSTTVKDFQDEKIIIENSIGKYGVYSASISKFSAGTLISRTYSSNSIRLEHYTHTSKEVLKNNNQYYNFFSTSLYPNPVKDTLIIHDNNLNIIKKIGLNSTYFGAFFRNNQLIVLSKDYNNSEVLYITIYDQNGNYQSQRSINDSINDFAYNDTKLVLANDTKFYTFGYGFNSYSVNNIGAKKVEIAADNIILTGPNNARVFNTLYNSLITLNNYSSQCFVADNNLDYYIIANGYLTKYNSNNYPVSTKAIPLFTDIKFKNDYFQFINKVMINWGSHYDLSISLININRNTPIYQTSYTISASSFDNSYYNAGIIDFAVLPSQDFLIVRPAEILKISNTGNTIWTKKLKVRHLFANNDNSFWIISTGEAIGLAHVQNDLNKCTYEVKNPFLSQYCPPTNDKLHQALVSFKGGFPLVNYTPSQNSYSTNLDKLGILCEWYKDGQKVDSIFYGSFSGNGNYKLRIKQEKCIVESETKYVSYSQAVGPSEPSISIDKPTICQGQSAKITATCINNSSLEWLDGNFSSIRTVTPNVTTSYFSNCKKSISIYRRYFQTYQAFFTQDTGPTCASPNTTATVNVYDGNQVTNLSGVAVGGMDYKGGKIISTQTIPGNQRNTYQFIKSAELRGSFSAANGSVLTIEADETCNN